MIKFMQNATSFTYFSKYIGIIRFIIYAIRRELNPLPSSARSDTVPPQLIH